MIAYYEKCISKISDFIYDLGLSPPVKYLYRQFQCSTSFVDHLVFHMLLRLFIAALWSPAVKGLIPWSLLVIFIVVLLLSHVISWVRCGT